MAVRCCAWRSARRPRPCRWSTTWSAPRGESARDRHRPGPGASSGIGAAITDRFAREGWRVFGTSRRPRESRPGVQMLTMDVRSDDAVDAAVAQIEQGGYVNPRWPRDDLSNSSRTRRHDRRPGQQRRADPPEPRRGDPTGHGTRCHRHQPVRSGPGSRTPFCPRCGTGVGVARTPPHIAVLLEHDHRVSPGELRQAVRSSGNGDLSQAVPWCSRATAP